MKKAPEVPLRPVNAVLFRLELGVLGDAGPKYGVYGVHRWSSNVIMPPAAATRVAELSRLTIKLQSAYRQPSQASLS